MSKLELKIIKAIDLPLTPGDELIPTARVKIHFNGLTQSTSVSDGKTNSPFWRETLVFEVASSSNYPPSSPQIRIEIVNEDMMSGSATLCSGSAVCNNLNIDAAEQSVKLSPLGTLVFKSRLIPDAHLTAFVLPQMKGTSSFASENIEQQQTVEKREPVAVAAAPVQNATSSSSENNNNSSKTIKDFPADQRERLTRTFEIFDVDESGELSQAEALAAFLTFFTGESASKLRKRILEADTNKDGNLDINEFARIAAQFIK
jgi:hypothetical protein